MAPPAPRPRPPEDRSGAPPAGVPFREVPFLAYVHSRDPGEPPEGRPAWEPNWRLWRWVGAAAVVAFVATHTGGALQALLVFIVFAFACRAALEVLPDGDGMREYRQ